MFRLYIFSHHQARYKILNKQNIKIQYSALVGTRSRPYIDVQKQIEKSVNTSGDDTLEAFALPPC